MNGVDAFERQILQSMVPQLCDVHLNSKINFPNLVFDCVAAVVKRQLVSQDWARGLSLSFISGAQLLAERKLSLGISTLGGHNMLFYT